VATVHKVRSGTLCTGSPARRLAGGVAARSRRWRLLFHYPRGTGRTRQGFPFGRPTAGLDWPSPARPRVECASRSSRGSALRHQVRLTATVSSAWWRICCFGPPTRVLRGQFMARGRPRIRIPEVRSGTFHNCRPYAGFPRCGLWGLFSKSPLVCPPFLVARRFRSGSWSGPLSPGNWWWGKVTGLDGTSISAISALQHPGSWWNCGEVMGMLHQGGETTSDVITPSQATTSGLSSSWRASAQFGATF